MIAAVAPYTSTFRYFRGNVSLPLFRRFSHKNILTRNQLLALKGIANVRLTLTAFPPPRHSLSCHGLITGLAARNAQGCPCFARGRFISTTGRIFQCLPLQSSGMFLIRGSAHTLLNCARHGQCRYGAFFAHLSNYHVELNMISTWQTDWSGELLLGHSKSRWRDRKQPSSRTQQISSLFLPDFRVVSQKRSHRQDDTHFAP